MDFDEGQFRRMVENIKSDKPQLNKECEPFYYSCSSSSKSFDSSNMSKEIINLFNFNQQVLTLTVKLWNDLLNLKNEQKIRFEESDCYSIVDSDECVSLNKYFFYYNSKIKKLKELHDDLKGNFDYLHLLNESLQSLEGFLVNTLPRLENNIKNLTIQVLQSSRDKSISYEVNNSKAKINTVINFYLQQLSQTVSHLKLTNVPDEIVLHKEKIQTKIKKTIDKKNNVLSSVLLKDESNFLLDHDTLSDTVYSYDPGAISNIKSKEIKRLEGNPLTAEQVNNNDINEHFVTDKNFKIDFEVPRAEPLSSRQINSIESTPIDNIVVLYGYVFSVFGFIFILIVLIFWKYKSKKERNENELILSDKEYN
ncbi:hypothetical protein NBO_7g0043 [Nosema bombycis CQ1]|uniref:Uncharacterized protein n=1 Tax=Nosema bombycis (strain CQ1 / CVCC 102059) TaxID=578461 RepID=R0MLU6_NOSB1|nr:hypothetical protein NBO_7g0043 [Nosema bombycis CQ1]|eukprot:EOB15225.1 hypothetical protein NBO_7g0043 [Nosema bombycis CQ1]